ncbi:hypothetical protein HanXRQr2_Chr03g0089191 [Helianthus annuus]|uniref:Uncharacterized protein n=1 Tax=Helianthus annuus TaxID=4232 RepID=A0A251V5J7_HELAN|nr:hypothetical protein HanXRQr2_Chr03g0089191 [Helianthus annuus]KAJ0591602.1 hypothetical protein HanHA300_Chr03g0075131 [Helianthus annuus]KAJ0772490.1 hypothetical protein HanOQP8_Chr03g0087911 [Helianthus annuus]
MMQERKSDFAEVWMFKLSIFTETTNNQNLLALLPPLRLHLLHRLWLPMLVIYEK